MKAFHFSLGLRMSYPAPVQLNTLLHQPQRQMGSPRTRFHTPPRRSVVHQHALGHSAALECSVVEQRLRYPDWGARKLKVLLAREGIELPRNTIHRILLRHNLVREEEQRSPATQRFEREHPNELWQMDFKGPKGWPQTVGPLSVLDDHSRYL
ncbi:MAG: hypothetical protein ACRD2U_02295, partial [Terriglobales bacterium]